MTTKILITLLAFTLVACAQTNTADIQNTAVAIARTGVALTQTALPTSLPPATPIPTEPSPPIITPDAIQVERWKEYQTELAKVLFSFDPEHAEGYDPEEYKDALCEWDILGQSGQEVYVWARCTSADGLSSISNPAVIYLESDGLIREVNVARAKADRRTQFAVYDLHLFPISVQEKICLYYFFGTVPQCDSIIPNYHPRNGLSSRERVLISHLWSRTSHAEEPPLIIISAMPTSTPATTPTATQPTVPILTPDAIQVERWKEYQTELAKLVLSDSGVANPIYADALCEWDILGRSGQEVYVWAVCVTSNSGGKGPVVIYLETDGSIQKVIAAGFKGLFYNLDLFPVDVQAKINLYAYGSGRADEMGTHLGYRLTHPEEPPLVVLSSTPIP